MPVGVRGVLGHGVDAGASVVQVDPPVDRSGRLYRARTLSDSTHDVGLHASVRVSMALAGRDPRHTHRGRLTHLRRSRRPIAGHHGNDVAGHLD